MDDYIEQFRTDVLEGLGNTPKFLQSKYLYDAKGDVLFQQIMNLPEYYLTDCELEIFREKTTELCAALQVYDGAFDLIELGPGDGTKSILLLHALVRQQIPFTYMPIDISDHILSQLQDRLARDIPPVNVKELHGDYLAMLDQAWEISSRRKIVMFLGSNIGNMELDEAHQFCRALRGNLQPGDRVLIGFDLRKAEELVLPAYDDSGGITAAFNLNLLERINRELGADFDLSEFSHRPQYYAATGECRSYLVSHSSQYVRIGETGAIIEFEENEAIHMEISRKYTIPEIKQLAKDCGFRPGAMITDRQDRFVDAIWSVSSD